MSLGENDSELLITTGRSGEPSTVTEVGEDIRGRVIRRCIDNTRCDPDNRNTTMVKKGTNCLYGVGVLDDTFIVAESGTEDKIFECSFTSNEASLLDCEVFANMPQGTKWDPRNLLVDPIRRLVYVADFDNSNVLVFAFDGAFISPLASSRGDLVQPAAMAQRPGLYAPLSPSHPPSSLSAAGERIEVALVMMDAYNSTVSNSHPTSVHDLALNVTATGLNRDGFDTTVDGIIL
jgi:hypothetical protein